MKEVLRLLSSMWLSQGSALYSWKRPFGDKLQQVTKQKTNLKLVILIFQVEILTAHLNPPPHLDVETKWIKKSQLCRNQGECQCWLWQVPGFDPTASGCSCSPLIWIHRDLHCFAKPRGTFQVEDLDVRVKAHSQWGWWWGEPWKCRPSGQCRMPEITGSSGCLIRGIFLIRLTRRFVVAGIYCTQAMTACRFQSPREMTNEFYNSFLKCFCSWPPKYLGAISSTG